MKTMAVLLQVFFAVNAIGQMKYDYTWLFGLSLFKSTAMKNLSLISFYIIICCASISAQKHDYNWILGHNGGTQIDFNNNFTAVSFIGSDVEMKSTNASISDKDGNLLFFTNGCDVFNANYHVLQNGAFINPGPAHNELCVEPFNAYSSIRGAIILPSPADDNTYYIFHTGIKKVVTPDYFTVFQDKLYYSVVDMSLDNGLGGIELGKKNKLILEDTLQGGDLTAIKHANNVDWWVIAPKRTSKKYFNVLFTSDGVNGVFEQEIGDSTLLQGSGGGQALFSPDGKLYVRYTPADDISLFDFDRETGLLSNHRHIPVAGDSASAGGAAISPNSRYLYISSETKFYQYDLQAPDIAATQTLIGEYDGFVSPFSTTFYQAQLAPDCKIYVNCTNSANIFHVIHHPDLPYPDCDFEQHGLQLATSNAFSLPNFPYYRLGSPNPICDSTIQIVSASSVQPRPVLKVLVFPNPASSQVTVSLPEPLKAPAIWSLHNPVGQEVMRTPLPAGQTAYQIHLPEVPTGLYFWQITTEGRNIANGKLVIGE